MIKNIIIFTFLLLLTTSCFFDKNDKDTVVIQGKNIENKTSTGTLSVEEKRQNRKEMFLKDVKVEDKQIFIDYDIAKANKDLKKEREIRAQVEVLESAKRKELEDAIKAGDKEKIIELRKYIRAYLLIN